MWVDPFNWLSLASMANLYACTYINLILLIFILYQYYGHSHTNTFHVVLDLLRELFVLRLDITKHISNKFYYIIDTVIIVVPNCLSLKDIRTIKIADFPA